MKSPIVKIEVDHEMQNVWFHFKEDPEGAISIYDTRIEKGTPLYRMLLMLTGACLATGMVALGLI